MTDAQPLPPTRTDPAGGIGGFSCGHGQGVA